MHTPNLVQLTDIHTKWIWRGSISSARGLRSCTDKYIVQACAMHPAVHISQYLGDMRGAETVGLCDESAHGIAVPPLLNARPKP